MAFKLFWMTLLGVYRAAYIFVLLGIAGIVWGVSSHRTFLTGTGGLLVLLPIPVAIWIVFLDPMQHRLVALVKAIAWHQWDEAERLLPLQYAKLPPMTVGFLKAQVLAGQGDIRGAIRYFDRVAGDQNTPDWLIYTRRGTLLLLANRSAVAQEKANRSQDQTDFLLEAISSFEQAIEKGPEQLEPRLLLASTVIQTQRDIPRTRHLLDSLDKLTLSDGDALGRNLIKGIIVVEENLPIEGIAILTKSFNQLQKYRLQPITEAILDQIRAYLTLAYAASGDKVMAIQEFRRCEPRLIATNAIEMLVRCRNALHL